MNKGFISLGAVAIIVAATLFFGGGTYGVYKYNQVSKEKIALEQELMKKEEVEIDKIKQSNEITLATTSSSTNGIIPEEVDQKNDSDISSDIEFTEQSEVKTIIEERVVYIPQPVETTTNEPKIETDSSDAVNEDLIVEDIPYLKISNVDVEVDAYIAQVSWETNKKSDSRLILELDEEKTFVSDNHDSTEHEVKLSGMEYSKTYSFEIIAEVDGEKDSHFGEVSTERKFEVTFKNDSTDNQSCVEIYVIDTAGEPLVDTNVELFGHYKTDTLNLRADPDIKRTNNEGMVKYCEKVTDIQVKRVSDSEIYFNGPIVYTE